MLASGKASKKRRRRSASAKSRQRNKDASRNKTACGRRASRPSKTGNSRTHRDIDATMKKPWRLLQLLTSKPCFTCATLANSAAAEATRCPPKVGEMAAGARATSHVVISARSRGNQPAGARRSQHVPWTKWVFEEAGSTGDPRGLRAAAPWETLLYRRPKEARGLDDQGRTFCGPKLSGCDSR